MEPLKPPAEPTPVMTKPGFFAGLALLLASIFPFLIGIGLLPIYLPPWAEKMTELWGPGFCIIVVIVLLLFRYVPRDAISSFVHAQEQQAAAMALVAKVLADMMGKDGELSQLKVLMQDVKQSQVVNEERWRIITDHTLHGEGILNASSI